MGIHLKNFQFENIIKEMLGKKISYCWLRNMKKEVIVLSINLLNFP